MISENPLLRITLFIAVFSVFFIIERLMPDRPYSDSRKKRIFFSIKLAALNTVFMKLLVTSPFILWIHYVNQKEFGLSHILGLQDGLIMIFVTVVLFDFLDAIKHLAFHRVPFMWRLHRAHHTDTHLDIWTSLRYHPIEFAISAVIKGGWIFLWGPSLTAFLFFEIILNMANQFHHSNFRLSNRLEKYLSYIFVTPLYHAIHHSIDRKRGDQNFSAIFSVWDLVLGSQKKPLKSDINLENLGNLQKNHLSVTGLLLSPLKQDTSAAPSNPNT